MMIVLATTRTGGHKSWWDLVRKYPEIREVVYARHATIENLTLGSHVDRSSRTYTVSWRHSLVE